MEHSAALVITRLCTSHIKCVSEAANLNCDEIRYDFEEREILGIH